MSPFNLTTLERAALDEAIRIGNARPIEHVSPDICQTCGGHGCADCNDCQCPRRACERKRRGKR